MLGSAIDLRLTCSAPAALAASASADAPSPAPSGPCEGPRRRETPACADLLAGAGPHYMLSWNSASEKLDRAGLASGKVYRAVPPRFSAGGCVHAASFALVFGAGFTVVVRVVVRLRIFVENEILTSFLSDFFALCNK